MDYVHSNVWGPTKTISLGGKHYYVTFIDDFSRRVWVYMLKTKDEVLGVFIKWKKIMETQTHRQAFHCQTYTTTEWVAERMNRTLLEKVWCMLSNDGLGKEFWAEVVTYACHLINRLPSTDIDRKTPFEKWYVKPATDYDSLHVFNSAAYYHVWGSPPESKAIAYGKVNVEQLDGTPKKVEFERIIVTADRETDNNSPMVEGDYEEEEVQTNGPL
ncbi:retrovirus-related pol polyprotein from transposon TNT 1-94 [Tanacetum coccineum]